MKENTGKMKKIIILIVALLLVIGIAAAVAYFVIKSNLIEEDEAQEIALSDAALSSKDVSALRSELEYDDGFFCYKVDFYSNGVEYEYEIRAKDGDIVSRDIDGHGAPAAPADSQQANAGTVTTLPDATEVPATTEAPPATEAPSTTADTAESQSPDPADTPDTPQTDSGIITPDEAKAAALADAAVSKSEATFIQTQLDYENGVQVYDIEFYTADSVYEYSIAASDGKVVKKEIDKSHSGGNAGNNSDTVMTPEEARAAAVADAGLSETAVTFTKTKLDHENGVRVYEIEFYTSDSVYDYNINASTGDVVKREVEKSMKPDNSSSGVITPDDARAAALADAGLSQAEVTFTKTELDRDDGVQVYELEFYTSSQEYDYEVSAGDGKILKREVERFNGRFDD